MICHWPHHVKIHSKDQYLIIMLAMPEPPYCCFPYRLAPLPSQMIYPAIWIVPSLASQTLMMIGNPEAGGHIPAPEWQDWWGEGGHYSVW